MYLPSIKSRSTICRQAVFNDELDLNGSKLTGQMVIDLMHRISPRNTLLIPFYDQGHSTVVVYRPGSSDGYHMVFLVDDGDQLTSLVVPSHNYVRIHVCDAASFFATSSEKLQHDKVIASGIRFVMSAHTALMRLPKVDDTVVPTSRIAS
ncbi:MAG: hypothetical protein WCI47_01395 [bacterium]